MQGNEINLGITELHNLCNDCGGFKLLEWGLIRNPYDDEKHIADQTLMFDYHQQQDIGNIPCSFFFFEF